MVQVIGNLLSNAAKYTPDGGDIRLSACAGRRRAPHRGGRQRHRHPARPAGPPVPDVHAAAAQRGARQGRPGHRPVAGEDAGARCMAAASASRSAGLDAGQHLQRSNCRCAPASARGRQLGAAPRREPARGLAAGASWSSRTTPTASRSLRGPARAARLRDRGGAADGPQALSSWRRRSCRSWCCSTSACPTSTAIEVARAPARRPGARRCRAGGADRMGCRARPCPHRRGGLRRTTSPSPSIPTSSRPSSTACSSGNPRPAPETPSDEADDDDARGLGQGAGGICSPRTTAGRATKASSTRMTWPKSSNPTRSPAP